MGIRPFSDTLRQIRYGELQNELAEGLNQLTKECCDTGKTGELVLKIKLKPNPAGQVEVLDDLQIKTPKPTRGTSIFFATPEGNLQREDPRQRELEGIREVPVASAEIREPKSA